MDDDEELDDFDDLDDGGLVSGLPHAIDEAVRDTARALEDPRARSDAMAAPPSTIGGVPGSYRSMTRPPDLNEPFGGERW